MTLTRADAARLGHMRRRILSTYDATTAEEREHGSAWYDRARSLAEELDPLNPARAAGVIAALSPRALWVVNAKWARDLIRAADRGDAEPPAIHTRAMRRQAWAIAQGADPLSVMAGPKVRRFFQNIMGDGGAVTVDVWAARVAEGRKDKRSPQGRRYDLIAAAYMRAAAERAVEPREMQAACWVKIRGRAA